MNRKLTAMLVVAVFLLVGGCSEKSQSVLSPIDSPSPATSVNQGSSPKAESPGPMAAIQPGLSTNCAVNLLTLPPPLWSTYSGASSTGNITASSGGKVSVSASYFSILWKQLSVSATLTVPPGAVSKDMTVTLSLDNKYVAVKFNPSGVKFSIPAKLNFNATGLDLSMVPLGAPIYLYYVNDNGLAIEKEISGGITANWFYGSLVCNAGWIPHFSRYAFAY